MLNELVNYQFGPFQSALKSNFMIYAMETNSGEHSESTEQLNKLFSVMENIHNKCIEDSIVMEGSAGTLYVKAPRSVESEFFAFQPHVSVGHSPFMFFKKENTNVGALVKLVHSRTIYDAKAIDKAARHLFEEGYRNDEPISLKDAKKLIKEQLGASNNVHNIGTITKVSNIYFYLDLVHCCLLSKSTQRDQVAINAFLTLTKRLALDLDESEKNQDHVNDAFSKQLYPQHYVNASLNRETAFGAYNITQIIEHYAKTEDDEDAPACVVSPTLTADFSVDDDHTKLIKMKNSVDVMSDTNYSPFMMLKQFKVEKGLNTVGFRVIGEIPKTKQITDFCEAFPESIDDVISGSTVSLTYDTKAKDGNIIFKIADDFKIHADIMKSMIRADISDNHQSKKQFELTLHNHFSGLLEVIHESITLFLSLYLDANSTPSSFDSPLNEQLEEEQEQEVSTG